MTITRRELLFSALGAGLATPVLSRGQSVAPFVLMPPERSGITWVHENARSESSICPRPWAWLRLPRLRQRRLDGHLPGQQRPLRFLPAAQAAAQRALPKQSRRHVHRRDREGRRGRRRRSAWAWRSAITTTTAGRISSSPSYGNCILYRNNRDGTFTDVTEKAGLETPGWTTSAVWFDYDNDGRLDLFVCSFVDYGNDASTAPAATTSWASSYYCIPRFFKPTAQLPLSQQRRRNVHRSAARGTDIGRSLGQRPRRGRHGHQ